ncbi:Receptor-type tyrosine-protein phosphatase O [Oryzias melastigma]|uniref:Receptor-type tyrosine-protein phosphatase O n=1 Tax=Oryzias melastigma TaxID=30732 RepID=A0A834FQF2_ORYME|nr:Receptor-type tyrosine-protein phosphatase O [Oryzias melastigma]
MSPAPGRRPPQARLCTADSLQGGCYISGTRVQVHGSVHKRGVLSCSLNKQSSQGADRAGPAGPSRAWQRRPRLQRKHVKCDHYWPFTDEPVMYGEVGVEMLSQSESQEWITRKFRLEYADETQDVLHLNYTSWPDHGVPTVNAIESILQFVHIVRQQANRTKDPIIVHCRTFDQNRPVCVSAPGVGRTGTFIALDRLMQHMREHEFVDILGMVSEMRSHRLSMVQTEEQYVFIHQCVLLMWQKKKQQSITSDVIYENASKT